MTWKSLWTKWSTYRMMFGCDKEERIDIYLQDSHTQYFFSEVPTIIRWRLRQWGNVLLQYNVLSYSEPLSSFRTRVFAFRQFHYGGSSTSYFRFNRILIHKSSHEQRIWQKPVKCLTIHCEIHFTYCLVFFASFQNSQTSPYIMNSNSVFWRQLFPSQSSAIRQIYMRPKNNQIPEFHDSSLFRHSLSFNSYMQRYEELNKVGEGMWYIAGNID